MSGPGRQVRLGRSAMARTREHAWRVGVTPTLGRVLCVDDEHAICTLLEALLTSEGYSVRTAPHGEAALEGLDKPGGWLPDVILLDIDMPVMDGYAFAHAYSKRAHGAPIIVVTAVNDPKRAAERVGAVAHIASRSTSPPCSPPCVATSSPPDRGSHGSLPSNAACHVQAAAG